MTSGTDYEGAGDEALPDDTQSNDTLPDEASEADVLEQRLTSTTVDDRPEEAGLPDEANPADVEEQRRSVGDAGEDDYR